MGLAQQIPKFTTKDGAQIFNKAWGNRQPVVFSHGWPLSADGWGDQMIFLASPRLRCIADDRRGHGRSSKPRNGNDMGTYADDLAELVESELQSAVHVDHSTGGGELARYIGRPLKIYPGLPHGMCSTQLDQINRDLLAFILA